MKLFVSILVLTMIFGQFAAAHAQQTDPNQYQARVAKEVQPYLSNCDQMNSQGGQMDEVGLASCKAEQAEFQNDYYNALEGVQDDKYELGFLFQKGDFYGVKVNTMMACAWWIEMENTGGRGENSPIDTAIVDACHSIPGADDEAVALKAEEDRVANLTY